MCRTVNVNDEIVVVSEGKKDIGKFAILGNDGKFDPSVIPVIDELQDQITKEVIARTEGDKTLQSNIDAEASTRTAADKDLQDQMNKEIAE
jgi:predicted MPP superfamily phosphohydrolase